MPGLWEWVIGGIALFIALFGFGIAIWWLIQDPEGKRLQWLQLASQNKEDIEPTGEKTTHKKELGLTETTLALGLIVLIAYIISRRKN